MITASTGPVAGDEDALAASQDYFTSAGRARVAQLVVVVLIPASVAVWAAITGAHASWIPLLGFLAAVADATWFNGVISSARFRAAQLSSAYDASLVMKTPSRTRSTGSPSADTIAIRSRSFMSTATGRRQAHAWHYWRIAEIAYPAAELLYIRSDLAQDEQLREWYVRFLYGALAIGTTALIAAAGLNNWAIGDIAGNVLFPAVPVFTWLGREVVDQHTALGRKARLRDLIDEHFFSEQVNPYNADDALLLEREALHGMQFHFRCIQPSVPGWLRAWKLDEIAEISAKVLDTMINDALHSNQARYPDHRETEFMQG